MRLHVSLLLCSFILSGCLSTRGPHRAIPTQDLRAEVPQDSVRAVFFNASHDLAYALTGDVQVEIDGEILPTLGRGEYVQVFLAPGPHELVLRHWDVIRFSDTYTLDVGPSGGVFRVWCRPLSTKYERVDMPLDAIQAELSPVSAPTSAVAGD